MNFEFETSDSIEQGGWLDKEGTYHFFITGVDPEPANKDNVPLAPGTLRIDCEVMAGTASDQAGKTQEITLFPPKATDKNNGEMARKKFTRLFLATCLLQEFKPGQKVSVDVMQLVGRQFVAKIVKRTSDKGKDFYELSYADIWHVDDPTVKDVPKNLDSLKLIPADQRKVFPTNADTAAASSTNGAKSQSSNPAAAAVQVASPAGQPVEVDDF
jgi:hypothetical protein